MKGVDMKRFLSCFVLSVTLLLFAGCGGTGDDGGNGNKPEPPQPGQTEVTLRFNADSGWVIHKPTPTNINGVYRYGPCLLLDEKGGIGMYTASPGNSYAEWDWGRYRYSADGGKTWGDEVVAVKPTPGQMDSVSTCDPGVFKMGDYYYAGYTSTYEAGGVSNAIFIARSKTPQGPFIEKWTGNGWSVYESRPAMVYDGDPTKFGIGEPSFVVKDNQIYMYYNWWDAEADGTTISQTRVALAEANNENWPATLQEHGVAFDKVYSDEDSSDIKYVEEYDMFIAVNTAKRFSKDSFIAFYESKDGLTFEHSTVIKKNIAQYCHNMGISGDEQGHIKAGDPIYIAYGYATGPNVWANWYTRMHKVTMTAVKPGTEDAQDGFSNSLKPDSEKKTHGGSAIETIHSREPALYLNLTDTTQKISLFSINNDYREEEITGSDKLEYTVQNEDILTVTAGGVIQPKKADITYVKAVYGGNESAYALIRITVCDNPFTRAIASAGASNLSAINNGGTFATASIAAGNSDRWFGVEGKSAKITGAAIFPKYQGQGFPSVFDLQYRANGEWKDVPGMTGLRFVVNKASSVTPVVLRFSEPVTGDALRIVDKSNADMAFELGEFLPLTGDMAKTELSTLKSEYVLDLSEKPRAQIMLEAVWNIGFCQEYYGPQFVRYSDYDTSVIAIDGNGMATAKKAGETTVTLEFFGQKITCKVTVQ